MSNLSDKEIDRLSREAADSFEPDASSLTWTRLEQKLVEQMPERPPDSFQFSRISPYIWGPAVVLIAGISFYFIKNNIYSKFSTPTIIPSSQVNKVKQPDSDKSVATHSYTDSLSAVPHASQSGANQISGSGGSDERSSSSATAKENVAGSLSSRADAQKAEAASLNKTASGSPSSNNGPGSRIIISSGMPATSGAASSNSAETVTTSGLALVSSAGGDGNSTHKASKYNMPPVIATGVTPGTVKGNDSLLNSLIARKSPEPQKSVHINRSLSIGFTFGADYTDGGGISNDQLSNNIGITLGYYLTNKLSVNTGLLYSNKFYWAPGDKQNRPMPAYGSNTTFAWAPDIEYVNGAFNMYELPLTLRYDFAKNEKTRFFVNAGASSYFLVKQTNIYYTHNGGGRLSAWLSKDDSPANYWFGVGDLSFGLETDIGKGFSFQAEPFFRVPFQKMGVENLKIFSYGIMLSFRYAPVLSRSKK